MILAKPLTRKGIGHSTGPEIVPTIAPSLNRIETESKPNENRIDISRKTVRDIRPKVRNKLLIAIIRDLPGLSNLGVKQVMQEFCKSQGFHDNAVDYSPYLLRLVRTGKIARIQISGKWRYVPNHG